MDKAVESWIKSQKYDVVEEPEINADVPVPYLKKHKPAFLYTINCDYNYAFVPMSYGDCSLLEQNGYTPVKLGYENSNGPIFSASGDLRIYMILEKNDKIDISYHHFLIKLQNYLSNYFDSVSISNNDILIDGKKVVGGALIEHSGMLIFVFQINFVNKQDVMKKFNITTKKKPGYIDSSIVTPEQVKDEFLNWLR